MGKDQLQKLKEKVFEKSSDDSSELTPIIELARGLSCLPDIIGRDYEIFDANDKLVFRVRQKPMTIKQLNTLLKEFNIVKKLDDKKEAAKWGTNKKGQPKRLNR